tara:strand:- start:88 stop:447 length:360 start_codon:yes stop_codon:yes gene_type:complete
MKTLIIAFATTLSLSAFATEYEPFIECTSFGTTATFMVNDNMDQKLIVTNKFFDKVETIVDEEAEITPSEIDDEGSVIRDTATKGKSVTLEISESMSGSLQINKPGKQFQSQGMNCQYL